MKTLVFGILAAVLGFLSVVGGILTFIGGLAYGIWTVITAIKTSTVTFWVVFKAVLFLLGSGVGGWIVFFVIAFFAGICAAIAKD